MSGFPKSLWVIEDWSTTIHPARADNLYLAPEQRGVSVQGRCPNRPGFERGICTSPIVRVQGRRIFTANGSRYVLGKPNAGFVEHCRKTGCHVPTHKHPILVKQANCKPKYRRAPNGRFLPRR